jgi:WD40 repeat protein
MKYHAFISYSHADRAWGEWLHRGIETFRIPKELVGRERSRSGGGVPRRLFPVFRDREELPTSADLGTMLRKALDASRYLVVICSPRAAGSRWVNEEVLHFKRSGRGDRVLCVIVDGEPNAADARLECFCPGLRHPVTENGVVDVSRHEEPIAADARPQGDGKRLALMKVVAGLAEVGFDELRQREQERSRRTMRRWLAAAVGLVLVFAGLAVFALAQRDRALAEEQRARETLSRSDFLQADELMTRGESHAALLHLSRAVTSDPEDIGARQRLIALLKHRSWPYEATASANTGDGGLRGITPLPGGARYVVQSSTGHQQVWGKDGTELSPPLLHDDVEWMGPLSYIHVIEPNGGRMASGGYDGTVRLWRMPGGEVTVPPVNLGSEVTAMASAPHGRHFLAGTEEGRVFLIGWDGSSRELPGIRPTDGKRVNSLAMSGDGQRIAAAWGGGAVRAGEVGNSGDWIDLEHPDRVNVMMFLDGNLITGCQDGGLRIWNQDSGRLQQEKMLPDEVGRIRVAPDGKNLLVGHGYFGDGWQATLFSPDDGGEYEKKLTVLHPIRDFGNRVANSGFGDCQFSPDGGRFLTWSGMDREVRCWSVADGKMAMEPILHPSPVGGAAYRTENEVVTAAADGRIRIWRWTEVLKPKVENLPPGYWIRGQWSGDKKRWLGLARAAGDGNQGIVAKLEQTSAGLKSRTITLPEVAIAATVTTSADQAFIGFIEGGVGKLNWTDDYFQPVPELETITAQALAMAGPSHFLLATKEGGLVRFNHVTRVIEEELELAEGIRFLQTDPTGTWAAVGMDSGNVWWLPTGRLSDAKKLPGHALMMATAAFSDDAGCLATADLDGRIQTWTVSAVPRLLFKVRQDAEVTALAFNRDGSVLAAGGRDDRVNCWSVEEAGELLSSISVRTWIAELAFNEDGRRLFVSDISGRVGVSDSWTGRWIVDPMAMSGETASCGWWGDAMFGLEREGMLYVWESSPPCHDTLAELGELVSKCGFTRRGGLQRISHTSEFRSEAKRHQIPEAVLEWWFGQ